MSASLKLYPLPSHPQETFSFLDKQYIKNHNGYFCTHKNETNLPIFKVSSFFEKIGKREYNQAKDKYEISHKSNKTLKKIQTFITF